MTSSSRPIRPSPLRQSTRHAFQAETSHYQRRKSLESQQGLPLQSLYLGIAVTEDADGQLAVGIASHDGTYSVDFAVHSLEPKSDRSTTLAKFLVERISSYQNEHLYKFVGAGLTEKVVRICPNLPSRLWLELDIIPLIFQDVSERPYHQDYSRATALVDEIADSAARKCLIRFGPANLPRLYVGYRNKVEVDCEGHAQISSVKDYQGTVGKRTWDATMQYAESLKRNKAKIAFFNSTPQGGGVALMRHALIRFLSLLDVQCRWYVPKPKPEVFRITKNNHNILQGVADPSLRLTSEQSKALDDWCKSNAEWFWTHNGPLAPRSEGGADVIIVDDPQMPSLVAIAKALDPDRPVIFRSHIQVRADLADDVGTPTSEVWNWIWNHVKKADLFISHPVREFVPNSVPISKVGYMPATTDWLDGLNKHLEPYSNQYYVHEFSNECFKLRANQLKFPDRPYIVQIARFDPAKGIPDVLASYAELRRKYMKDLDIYKIPQLVIAGHGAIDDPDATIIFDETINALETEYDDIQEDVIVMRLGPTDQILNVLMQNAHVALQLSTREGFEVKVSEAVHKGVPVIATRVGGIPLQVQHGKSGFLVEPGDSSAVARYLHYLFTDEEAHQQMSDYAHDHVSDEVSTVGNALCWLYLADMLSKGEKIEPDSRWINDMAREYARLPYEEGETRLPRVEALDLHSPAEERSEIIHQTPRSTG